MSISISSIFLMSVLVLGFASYPPLLPNSENGVDAIDDLQLQLGSIAFAQEENSEEEQEEEEEIELRGKIASIGPGNQFTLESGEVILTDENTDFDDFTSLGDLEVGFEVDIDAVLLDGNLLATEIEVEEEEGSLDLEIEEEFEVEIEDRFEEEDYEIEVEVKKGKAKVKIELDDEKYRFVIKDNPTEEEIISTIVDKTGLEPSFITSIWEFEYEEAEEEGEEEELSIEKQAKLAAKIAKHELKAKQNADEKIIKLQQKIDQLEQRLQKLLDKFEAGEYFGTIPEPDPVTTSYIISFDGSATSLNDDSVVTDVDGEIFLETQVTRSDTTKFRVTGGEILVGDTFYDFVIGKARVSSSGTSGEKDAMMILGQIMDDQGNVNTIKIFVHTASPLSGDFGSEPIDLELKMPQSKIAKHWSLSASGQLSLLQA